MKIEKMTKKGDNMSFNECVKVKEAFLVLCRLEAFTCPLSFLISLLLTHPILIHIYTYINNNFIFSFIVTFDLCVYVC